MAELQYQVESLKTKLNNSGEKLVLVELEKQKLKDKILEVIDKQLENDYDFKYMPNK